VFIYLRFAYARRPASPKEFLVLTVEDRLAIHELVALYGHVIDERQFSRTGELFTDDARYDVSDFSQGVVVGTGAIVDLWRSSERHPLAHHATNVVVTQDADGTTRVLSKGIGVLADGKAGSVTYRDVVVKTPLGWRIRERVALRRRADRIPEPS
jgi:hypothetical protein